jgi:hypothetical protein
MQLVDTFKAYYVGNRLAYHHLIIKNRREEEEER